MLALLSAAETDPAPPQTTVAEIATETELGPVLAPAVGKTEEKTEAMAARMACREKTSWGAVSWTNPVRDVSATRRHPGPYSCPCARWHTKRIDQRRRRPIRRDNQSSRRSCQLECLSLIHI